MRASKRHHVSVSTDVKHGAGGTRLLVLVTVTTPLGWGRVVLSGPVGSEPGPARGSAGPSVAPASAPALNRAAAVPATQEVLPATDPLTPDPALLSPGDTAPRVRVVQARLRQLGWYAGRVTDHYGPRTATAAKGFQAKRRLPVLGYVAQPTLDRLRAVTRKPN